MIIVKEVNKQITKEEQVKTITQIIMRIIKRQQN